MHFPTLGRFTTKDPILEGNLYAYVLNNPANGTDPEGLKITYTQVKWPSREDWDRISFLSCVLDKLGYGEATSVEQWCKNQKHRVLIAKDLKTGDRDPAEGVGYRFTNTFYLDEERFNGPPCGAAATLAHEVYHKRHPFARESTVGRNTDDYIYHACNRAVRLWLTVCCLKTGEEEDTTFLYLKVYCPCAKRVNLQNLVKKYCPCDGGPYKIVKSKVLP